MALSIAAQGSFAAGGTLVTRPGTFDPRRPMDPGGQTLHGDHARVTYQTPVDARPVPLLFWHGWWVDSSCWDTTPDGKGGFPDPLPASRLSGLPVGPVPPWVCRQDDSRRAHQHRPE